MLIEFYGKNFGCFRDEFRLSMLATDIEPGSDRGVVEVEVEGDDEPLCLLRAVALYGPNGSGKSTLIRAAGALRSLFSRSRFHFRRSDMALGPYEPFLLGPESTQPIQLGVRAVVGKAVYDYAISFDRSGYQKETLKRLSQTEEMLFHREGKDVKGSWTTDPQFQLIRSGFRSNASLLALADSLTPRLAKEIAVGLRRALVAHGPFPNLELLDTEIVARKAQSDPRFLQWLTTRLRNADLGVRDVQIEELQRSTWTAPINPETGEEGEPHEQVETFGRIELVHSGQSEAVQLPYHRESLGTQRLVQLSPLLFELIHSKRCVASFVDEFDASMHPQLIQAIVRNLNCEVPAAEVRGQLIFATHETTLMDREPPIHANLEQAVLRRDQVYFTEKGADGASRLYSLAEFKERNNLNIRRRYLQGRYGALPALGSFSE